MQCRPGGVCVRCGAARLAFVFRCGTAERPMDAVDLGVGGLTTISSFGRGCGAGAFKRPSVSLGSERHGRLSRVQDITQSQPCQPQKARGGGGRAVALRSKEELGKFPKTLPKTLPNVLRRPSAQPPR